MAKKARNRKKAVKALKRRPRSWLGVVCVLFSLGAVALTTYDTDAEGRVTDPAAIFAAFADTGFGADEVVRMRGSPLPPSAPSRGTRWHTVVAAPDGDTLKLDNGQTVRLIGVDTPESDNNRKLREDLYRMGIPVREKDMAALGMQATDFTRYLTLGRRCWLEFESGEVDQYGRALAYVHLEDGRILNEEILRQGFGRVYLSYSFKYRKRYILLQAQASMNRLGLWRETRPSAHYSETP